MTGREGPSVLELGPPRRDVQDPRACFFWGVLAMHEQQTGAAIDWIDRATRLDVGDYWYQYYLGYIYQRVGDDAHALSHYDVAISLRPDLPWPDSTGRGCTRPRGPGTGRSRTSTPRSGSPGRGPAADPAQSGPGA